MKGKSVFPFGAVLLAALASGTAASDHFYYREKARLGGKTAASGAGTSQTIRRSNPKKALRHCLPRR